MDKLIELSEELKKELDSLPLFQEYSFLKKEIENNKELKELKRKIILAKKDNNVEEHQRLLDEYNSHPLVVNFLELQEEVLDYLKTIGDILNEK